MLKKSFNRKMSIKIYYLGKYTLFRGIEADRKSTAVEDKMLLNSPEYAFYHITTVFDNLVQLIGTYVGGILPILQQPAFSFRTFESGFSINYHSKCYPVYLLILKKESPIFYHQYRINATSKYIRYTLPDDDIRSLFVSRIGLILYPPP